MKSVVAIAYESFLLMRRDRVFIPALVCGFMISVFAVSASDWGIEEFQKILMDVGFSGFFLTGCFIAIYWGTKVISDSKAEGSLEVQLAAPISRSTWLLGKYLGLSLALLSIGALLLAFFQLSMYLGNFYWIEKKHLIMFSFIFLSWLVIGALSFLYASLGSTATALFATFCTVLVGLTIESVSRSLPAKTPAIVSFICKYTAEFWNLSRFNLSILAEYQSSLPNDLGVRLVYGISLIMVFLTLSLISFRKRDLL